MRKQLKDLNIMFKILLKQETTYLCISGDEVESGVKGKQTLEVVEDSRGAAEVGVAVGDEVVEVRAPHPARKISTTSWMHTCPKPKTIWMLNWMHIWHRVTYEQINMNKNIKI